MPFDDRPTRFERLLLAILPRAFRRRFQDELLRFWREERADSRDGETPWGRVRYEAARVADAFATGLRTRLRPLRRPRPHGNEDRERERTMGGVAQDLRYAARSLTGVPLYTSVAVATLALGIGANAAIFNVVNGVLLRPLPYDAPDQLYAVHTERATASTASWPDFADWQGRTDLFQGLAGAVEYSTDAQWDDEAEQLPAGAMSRNALGVLGVEPLLGRPFTADEDRYGGFDAVLLSEGLWDRRFGRDPQVLGRTVTLGGTPHTVVGVLPASFAFPDPGLQAWTPLQEAEGLEEAGLRRSSRTLGFVRVTARLREGVDPDAAARALAEMAKRTREAEGIDHALSEVWLQPLHEQVVGGVRGMMLLVFGSVGLVLLVACANLAGLALTRAATRTRELAVRTALGATAGRLARQILTESLLLALLGGGAGLVAAFGFTEVLIRLAPPGLPRLDQVGVDLSVVAFTLAVSIVTGLAFGLLPAVRASRTDLRAGLKDGGRGPGRGPGGHGLQQTLVVGQVAVAVALVAGAALLGKSLTRLLAVDPGFEPDGLLRVEISVPSEGYEESGTTVALYRELLEHVRALPGVQRASATYSPPLAHNDLLQSVTVEGQVEDPDRRRWVGTVIAQTDYFETLGLELLRGRSFDGTETAGEPPVAVVNETMAREFWPGEDPVGKRFYFTGGLSGSVDRVAPEFFPREPFTVIGVVEDVRRSSLAAAARPEFYRPHAQMGWGSLSLMVRARDGVPELTARIRRILRELDPRVSVRNAVSMGRMISGSVAAPRFRTLLMGGFAAMACLLALVGVYAVMAYAVATRTREIGIRMALGAPADRVRRETLTRGLILAGAGILLGVAGAAAGTRTLASMLFEVSPTDPSTFALVAVGVGVAAGLASYLPALRASRVDPARSLQVE